MKKLIYFALFFSLAFNSAAWGENVTLIDEKGNKKETVEVNEIFKFISPDFLPAKKLNGAIDLDDLSKTAKNALSYLNSNKNDDPLIFKEGVLSSLGITLKDVKRTLAFISETIEYDQKNKLSPRMLDSNFIKKNFKIIRWYARGGEQYKVRTENNNIRLTKYVVYTVKGSKTKTQEFDCALYAVPKEEAKMSVEQANKNKDSLIRYKYTKQDVMTGVYEKDGESCGKTEAIAWLTRDGLEEAIMEGTIKVKFNDGTFSFFNVDRNNGILYDRSIKTPRLQKRYWYFKKVDGIKGYGKESNAKITIYPRSTFAGDIYNIGLGKFVLLKYPHDDKFIMGIIADTGGAFIPNLYQLDFLSGVFNSKKEFIDYVSTLPEQAECYILIKKD